MRIMKKVLMAVLLMLVLSPTAFAGVQLAAVGLQTNLAGGGSLFIGGASLNQAAGHNGALVMLTVSNPTAITCPASVFIPEGSVSVTFECQSHPVADVTPNTLTGKYKTTIVRDAPIYPAIIKLVETVSRLYGGQTSSLYILMDGVTVNDTLFNVTSSDPAVLQVPSTVTMPAGGTGDPTVSYYGWSDTVTTSPVTTTQTVTITASHLGWGGNTFTETWTVTVDPL
jgi:hypothetical protein